MLDETTTTDTQVEGAAEVTSQATTTPESPAEAQETQTQSDQQIVASDEPDPGEWLRKKANIDPNDPDVLHKVAEAWKKADQDFHKSRQDKGQLQSEAESAIKGLATEDEVIVRMNVLETRQSVRDFYDTNPGARELDAEMGEIVKAKPYLAQDLEAVYALAKSAKHDSDLEAAKESGRKEAKAQIAKASVAGTPRGNASSSRSDKSPEEERLERFSNW